MFKMLLVDDDPNILRGMSVILNYEEYGIEISGCAANGLEALQCLLKTEADILLTDIKMPEMDGIELIRQIKKLNLNTKCIILSSYDDFTYVKEAAKLGIENYLLKPIEEEELSSTLLNITERLDHEQKEEIQKRKDSNILKENIIFRWLTKNISEFEMHNRANFLGIRLDQEFYLVCIVRILDRKYGEGGPDYQPAAVQNICVELLTGYCNSIVINSMLGDTVILFSGKAADFDERKTIGLMQAINKKVNELLNVNLFISIGSYETNYASAPTSFSKADSLQKYHIVSLPNTVITPADIHDNDASDEFKIDFERLKKAVLINDAEQVRAFIAELHCRVQSASRVTPDFIRNLIYEILYIVFGTINLQQLSGNFEFENDTDFSVVLSRYSLPNIFDWLSNIVVSYVQRRQSSADSLSPICKVILAYIDQNYMKDLSLKTISSSYHINTAYLGQMIKKATGKLFSDYLNSLRIEKAKKLLAETNMKEYDIAIQVGYTNVNYFSNLFKKIIGIYPTEYRKSFLSTEKILGNS